MRQRDKGGARVRAYSGPADYRLVYEFLLELYQPDTHLPYWLGPRREYMHAHPLIERIDRSSIGIAETAAGRTVGVIHPEHVPDQRYVQLRPGHERVLPALVEWAEHHPAEPPGVKPTGLGVALQADARAALTRVAEAGLTQSLLSMAHDGQLQVLVDHHHVRAHFLRIEGSPTTDNDGNKAARLARHLAALGLDPAACVKIGDTVDDYEAASACGASAVLVTTGSTSRASLEETGAPVVDTLVGAAELAVRS